MPEAATLHVWINGRELAVPAGCIVSAALLRADEPCRTSVTAQPRTALCGMGICFECRAVVNGIAQQRTCQMLCTEGMRVETQR